MSLQEREPAELLELGGASEPVLDRVNQSHLTTIDPLLAVEA